MTQEATAQDAHRIVAQGQGKPFSPPKLRNLAEALLVARSRAGGKAEALEDPERQPLSYSRLILGALILGKKLSTYAEKGGRIGVLLPNVNGLVVSLFGLWFLGRVPVMLNFTAGLKNLRSAARTSKITTIITSRRFIDTAKLEDVVAGLSESGLGESCQIVFLEDIRKTISTKDKLLGMARMPFAAVIANASARPEDPAVVLFTSGSEGEPKGVVLSHRNLMSNAMQIFAFGDGFFKPGEVVFNPLPAFHSFGLTAGVLFGLLNGMKIVLYPSPLHYKQVPKLVGDVRATILFGTDTFLTGYARAAEPQDLMSVKLVVAGAERVKDETRKLWAPWPAVIVEGYGCTECSPVLAVNHPATNTPGTVGFPLPGVDFRLEHVTGIEDGGKLVVSGPNVMLGYMLAESPGDIRLIREGWYDTGDIVALDVVGRITIKGRAKRFAKLGGEMVSLAAIEALASALWPGNTHVGVTLPDAKKGEQIILVTDRPEADRAAFLAYARSEGVSELYVPRAFLVVGSIPVLGSGKVDYAGTTELAKTMRAMI